MSLTKIHIRNYIYMGKKLSKTKIMEEEYCQVQIKPLALPVYRQQKKEKLFKQIFKLSDPDEEDSKISSPHINTSKLPKNIL